MTILADAYCPSQRGSNENRNGLLRQYLRKTDLSLTNPVRLTAIVQEVKCRPVASPRMEDSRGDLSSRQRCVGRLKPPGVPPPEETKNF